MTVCQKVPILDFQNEFSMSKIIQIFLKKIFMDEYQLRRTFFVKIMFSGFKVKTLELVSKELNHFGVIADLFRQIWGHSTYS